MHRSRFGVDDSDLESMGWRDRPDGREDDPTQAGRSSQGHRFGEALGEDERRAVLEYLKTREARPRSAALAGSRLRVSVAWAR
jgi:mono/diheme cytochrome c family protein